MDTFCRPTGNRLRCPMWSGLRGSGLTAGWISTRHGPLSVTTMPVVAMQMPAEPVERDIYSELLAALGAPGPNDGTTHRQKDICRRLLRSVGARMLIIDEIHAMLAGSFRQQRIFLNAIRFLANDLRIPLVCVGTDLARQALITDPQLAERFEAFQLQRWKSDARLAQLLASLATILPLRRPSNLAATAICKRVLDLTDGVTVRIFRLIETLGVEAIRSGEECIRLDEAEVRDLVLPLVAMTHKAEGRLRHRGSR